MVGVGLGFGFGVLLLILTVLATAGVVVLFIIRRKTVLPIVLFVAGLVGFNGVLILFFMHAHWVFMVLPMLLTVGACVTLIFVGKKGPAQAVTTQGGTTHKGGMTTNKGGTPPGAGAPSHSQGGTPAGASASRGDAAPVAAPKPEAPRPEAKTVPEPKPAKVKAPAPPCKSVVLEAGDYDIPKLREQGEAFSKALADLTLEGNSVLLFGEVLARVKEMDPAQRARVTAETQVRILTADEPVPLICPACGTVQEYLQDTCESCNVRLPFIIMKAD